MLRYLSQELAELSNRDALKKLHVSEPLGGAYLRYKGKKVLDLTSWDLLGISKHPEFQKALHIECTESGLGGSRARLTSGTTRIHKECEERIGTFLGTENALLFSSKNQAILSLITSLLSERDAVLVDELIQSPVVDASFLVNAQIFNVSIHASSSNLEKELEKARYLSRRLIFVEAISPLTGVVIDLEHYLHLAERFDAYIVIDESYSLGILGDRGAGVLDGILLPPRVLCRYGTLGGCAASYGAFIAGSNTVIDYLANRSRTLLFESSLPPLVAAGAKKAIDIIETSVSTRAKLITMSTALLSGLTSEGVSIDVSTKVPVVCFHPMKPSIAIEFVDGLFQRGFLVESIQFGSSRNDQCTVRVLLNSLVSEANIDTFLESVCDIGKKLRSKKLQLT